MIYVVLCQWLTAHRYYVQKTFSRKLQNTKVICPIMWTYDLCAADSSSYYDYCCVYKITIYSNDVNRTQPSVQLLAINILCYFVIRM